MQTKFLFIDAETDGLYGSFLTVGLVVTDDAGNMIEKAYYGIKKENMMISSFEEHIKSLYARMENL